MCVECLAVVVWNAFLDGIELSTTGIASLVVFRLGYVGFPVFTHIHFYVCALDCETLE